MNLSDDAAYAYAIPAGRRSRVKQKAAQDIETAFVGERLPARRPAITRSDVVHMRALHALDVESGGASELEIAGMVLGETLAADIWNDSALRAKVRYLLDHGRRFRDGGYRQLLRVDSLQPVA